MPLTAAMQALLSERYAEPAELTEAKESPVKRGDAIFAGTDYPRTFDGFVGQAGAVAHLTAHMDAVLTRGARRLDHILLSSGLHGIGKTTLAMLIAANASTQTSSQLGYAEVSGALSIDEGRDIITQLNDGDILFWDEIHLAVAGNRNRADWTLPLLTDHVLMTGRGREEMPDITIIGATTDAGKLPQTLISRFMVRPKLVGYTLDEAVLLVDNLAARMRVDVRPGDRRAIAEASNCNPRAIRMILTAYRDLPTSNAGDLGLALEWAGFTHDGLTVLAADMLLALLASKDLTASIDTIQAQLGEPGTLRHDEQTLLQRGYVSISGRGRVLTEDGQARAIRAIRERV